MKIALLLEVNSDANTAPAYEYRFTAIRDQLKERFIPDDSCAGKNATSTQLENYQKWGEVEFITGVSHGDAGTYFDKYHATSTAFFLKGHVDANQVYGKIVHLLACETAVVLGRHFVKDLRCAAFFGYQHKFNYPECMKDLFLSCDAAIDLAIAKGCSPGKAFDAALTAYEIAINARFDAGDLKIYDRLKENRDNLCFLEKGKYWRGQHKKYEPMGVPAHLVYWARQASAACRAGWKWLWRR